MSKRELPIIIITGYPGSGKTTFMQGYLLKKDKSAG